MSSNMFGWSKGHASTAGTNVYDCRNLPITANLEIHAWGVT